MERNCQHARESPTVAGIGKISMAKQCCIDGCTKDISKGARGMCAMHTQRVRRYGDPNYITPEAQRRANNRASQLARFDAIKETTYRKHHGRHEHRIVAERLLGRPLAKGEIVHHKDGNKHNNDPSNLEVMTQSEHMKLHWEEMRAARKAKHGF
jgi:hypothetical protein